MLENPNIFWGIVASMYIGNVMLLILNLPLIGMWVQVLKVPDKYPVPDDLAVLPDRRVQLWSNSIFDIYVMIVFGVLGYLMRKLGYEPAPLVPAFVSGRYGEQLAQGADHLGWQFLDPHRPARSRSLVSMAALLLATAIIPLMRTRRATIAIEQG